MATATAALEEDVVPSTKTGCNKECWLGHVFISYTYGINFIYSFFYGKYI